MKIFNNINHLISTAFVLILTLPLHAESAPEKTAAEFIEQPNVTYPESEKAKGNEGWVRLNFIVAKDGTAKDLLIQDSYGGPAFERAAIDAIKQTKFKPASYKGQTVEQNLFDIVINIASDNIDTPVDQGFIDQYQKAVDFLSADDLVSAKSVVSTIENTGNLSLYEIARLEVLKAQFAAKDGDQLDFLRHLRNARIGYGIYLPESMLIDVIRMHSAVALQNSLFYEAFDSYGLLEKIAPENDLVTRLAMLQAPIKKAIREGRPIRVGGILDERGQWIYQPLPLRTNFSFTFLGEGIKTFEPRCEHSNKKFTAEQGKEWRIPDSWGACSIAIYGEPGAKFELMEYANTPDES